MKNHELLELIGDVNEDYVLEAGNNVVKPRFRWKTVAACAACAALVLGAYPVYRAAHPPLHSYTVLEGGAMNTLDGLKLPAGEIDVPGQNPPNPDPEQPVRGNGPVQSGGACIGDNTGDIPVDEPASDQYDRLLRGMGMHGEGAASYPDWFAGAWIDHGGAPDAPARLTVAIVEGLRTPEREAEILGWVQGGVTFRDAKYSHNFLDGLMEQVVPLLDGTGLSCGIGVDVIANCLGVDLYSNGQTIPDSILARLAKLDPAGDAIRVRLFTGKLDTLTDDLVKGPAPVDPEARATPATTVDGEPHPTPVDGDKVYHGEDAPADAVPGGAVSVGELPQSKGEDIQPARYDLLPLDE